MYNPHAPIVLYVCSYKQRMSCILPRQMSWDKDLRSGLLHNQQAHQTPEPEAEHESAKLLLGAHYYAMKSLGQG